jgi:hypothetical protein
MANHVSRRGFLERVVWSGAVLRGIGGQAAPRALPGSQSPLSDLPRLDDRSTCPRRGARSHVGIRGHDARPTGAVSRRVDDVVRIVNANRRALRW